MLIVRRAVAVAAAGALALIPAAAASSSPAQYKDCGSQNHTGGGWYNVRAHNIGCHHARNVARQYWHNGGGDEQFKGWTCRDHQIGDEVWRARCDREQPSRHQIVKFVYGA